jgi:hypothetical protein
MTEDMSNAVTFWHIENGERKEETVPNAIVAAKMVVRYEENGKKAGWHPIRTKKMDGK